MGHNLLQITNATTSSEAEAHNLIKSGYLSDLGDQHFERIHSDLHEVPCLTSSSYRYWLMFIDDCSRYTRIYLLKRKSEAFDAFKLFKAMVEKQYDAVICFFHEDKGSEYIGHKWDASCGEHGIWRAHTTRATPQQNGVAERKNRTLAEIVTAMLNVLIQGYLCDIELSLMYLCSDLFHGLVVSRVVFLPSCTKCHVALIMLL
jgi:transposase InsO family protein